MTKALMNQHKIDFGMARKSVESLRQAAIDFPQDSVFLQVDGMDNSKVGEFSLKMYTWAVKTQNCEFYDIHKLMTFPFKELLAPFLGQSEETGRD